jgi:hypothetical protein
MKNGKRFEGWADERYRGGPENPLSDDDLEAKVRSCCEGILPEKTQSKLLELGRSIGGAKDTSRLMEILNQVA